MRLRPAGRPPPAVRGPIRLMCVGAAGSVALAIAMVVTIGSVKSAVMALDPAPTAAQWHGVLVEVAIREWTMPLAIAVWLWLAWANGRGHNWARLAFGAWFILCGLMWLSALAQGVALVAPVIFAVGTVQCLIAAAATVLLFSRRSSLYYQPETAVQ
jgi:hypothetical protein